ncbi:MAG: hypothetical protein AAF065_04010 [Verrucomicrobiota bacterium]
MVTLQGKVDEIEIQIEFAIDLDFDLLRHLHFITSALLTAISSHMSSKATLLEIY